MTILEGLMIRPPTLADAEAVSTLTNVCALEIESKPATTPEEVARFWQLPGVDLAQNYWLVSTSDGKIAAYCGVSDQGETHTSLSEGGLVHPDFRGRGIGSHLLELAEARAREFIPLAPPNARVTLGSGVNSKNEIGQQFLIDHGFELRRHFYNMEITLDNEPAEPHWPAGISVRPYVEGQEEPAVFAALMDAFKDHWGFVPAVYEEWLAYTNTGDRDPGLNFIVLDGDQIAGLALCRPRMAEDPELGWVDDLGVRRPWRRKGLAYALLQHSFREFYKRGTKRVGLGVDASSLTGATGLYNKAGMHIVRQYNSFGKVLRDGEELMTQSIDE
jgi:GNAT superfamily N-acetyltransferase